MIHVIRSKDRYHFETDWLSTYWHFSFDHYYDPWATSAASGRAKCSG